MIYIASLIPLIILYYLYFDYFLLFIFIPIAKINLSFIPYKFIKDSIVDNSDTTIYNNINTEFFFPSNTIQNYILPSLQISYSIQDFNYILIYYIIIVSTMILLPFLVIQIFMYLKPSFYKHEIKNFSLFFIFLFFYFFVFLFLYNNYIVYFIFNSFYNNYQEINFIIFDINLNLQNYLNVYLYIFIISYLWIMLIIIIYFIFNNNIYIILCTAIVLLFVCPLNIYIHIYFTIYCITTYITFYLYTIYNIVYRMNNKKNENYQI